MKTARVIPLLLSLSIGQALADTPISLTQDAAPNAHVSISSFASVLAAVRMASRASHV